MITGVVQAEEASIGLTIRGQRSGERQIEAVIDTGYTGSLSLPPRLIAALDLRWQGFDRGILADGSECLFDVYEANVLWDGNPCRILVDEADTDPLVGMELLNGYELKMEVRSGGLVTIRQLLTQSAGWWNDPRPVVLGPGWAFVKHPRPLTMEGRRREEVRDASYGGKEPHK